MNMVIKAWTITEGNDKGRIGLEVPMVMHDRVKKIPGARYSRPAAEWSVPKAWTAVLALGTLAKTAGYKLERSEELRDWMVARAAEWKRLRELAALVPPPGTEKAAEAKYYPHQEMDAEWLIFDSEETGRLLLSETGIGKTMAVVCALEKLQERGQLPGPVLITSPESVMKTGWMNTFSTYAPQFRAIEITGTPVKRAKLLAEVKDGLWDVVVIGHSNLKSHTRFEAAPGQSLVKCAACSGTRVRRDSDTPVIDPDTGKEVKEVTVARCQMHSKELNEIGWSVVVVDEIHRAMNSRSQISQAIWGVNTYSPTKTRRWGLTGTIISKQTDQAWAPLHYASPDNYPVKTKWIDWYCIKGSDNYGYFKVLGLRPDRQDEFRQTFSALTRRVLKDQVLDLPPKLRWGGLQRNLRMSGEQLRVYEEMRKEMALWVDEGLITAANVAVQAGRLAMLASGTGFPDPENQPGQPQKMLLRLPSVKVDEILSMFRDDEFGDSQVGFLFSSSTALHMFEKAFYAKDVMSPDNTAIISGKVSKRDRDWAMEDFQAGKRRFVLLTYGAGGTGVTLNAANQIVVVQRDWSPILNAQGEDRFHRIGSEKFESVVYHDLVVENSCEVGQLERMSRDAATLEELVQDKHRLKELLGL